MRAELDVDHVRTDEAVGQILEHETLVRALPFGVLEPELRLQRLRRIDRDRRVQAVPTGRQLALQLKRAVEARDEALEAELRDEGGVKRPLQWQRRLDDHVPRLGRQHALRMTSDLSGQRFERAGRIDGVGDGRRRGLRAVSASEPRA